MARKTLFWKRTRYVDADGVEHVVEVTPDVAAVLAELEPPLKERLLKDPGAIAGVADPRDRRAPLWLRFTWLVGESRTWAGEPRFELEGEWYCSVCWERALPTHAYCLGCDRSGRDEVIAKAEEPAAAVAVAADDGLEGGLEGKR